MASPPYKESIRPGDIKLFKIKGSNGESVDISGAIAEFYYYESILSNTVTATVAFIDTGFEKEGTGNGRTKTSGIINELQLVGGEEVYFEVVDNGNTGSEEDGTITSEIGSSTSMTLKTIRNVGNPSTKQMFILDLVTQDYWINEETRVTKRYDGNPGNHVQNIMTEIMGVPGGFLDIEQSGFDYNFIGNTKKPLHTCTWLASKSNSSSSPQGNGKSSEGASAGFFFFQTRDKYNFKSIDTLSRGQVKSGRDFIYNNTGKEVQGGLGGKTTNILNYVASQQTDIAKDLSLGVYNNKTIFFNPYSLSYRVRNFSFDKDKKSVKLLNGETNSADERIRQKPSRLLFRIDDIGTLPQSNQNLVSDKENPDPTYQADKLMVQALMRYNELFRTKINILIPGNFGIRAGDVVHCTFADLNSEQNQNENLSGKYIVASVCHKLNSEQTLSSIDIVRDSLGDSE